MTRSRWNAVAPIVVALVGGVGGDACGSGGGAAARSIADGSSDAAGTDADATDTPDGASGEDPCPDAARAADGTCTGVPPELCADGLAADGARGCTPILPQTPCASGQVAWPGETACHDVAPCPDTTVDPWAGIPVEADTVYVAVEQPAGVPDGTRAHPWKNAMDAVATAPSGAIVAIAAGDYGLDLGQPVVVWRPLRLWGVCPSRVTLSGLSVQVPGVEVRDVSIAGYGAAGTGDVFFDGVWARPGSTGFQFTGSGTAGGILIQRSLVEGAVGEAGIVVDAGRVVSVRRVVVRGVREAFPGDVGTGNGIVVSAGATLTASAMVLDENARAGLFATAGSRFQARAIVVRKNGGSGVLVEDGATASIAASVFSGNGIDSGPNVELQGGGGALDGCTVGPGGDGGGSGGVVVWVDGPASVAAKLDVRRSKITGGSGYAIAILGSAAAIAGSLVEGGDADARGVAIGIGAEPIAARVPSLGVTSCVVSGARVAALTVLGGTADVVGTRISGVAPQPDGAFGDGIVFDQSSGSISGGVVEAAARAGLSAFSADVAVAGTAFRANQIDIDVDADPKLPPPAPRGTIEDHGGNVCTSNGAAGTCAAASANLEPPRPIGDGGAP